MPKTHYAKVRFVPTVLIGFALIFALAANVGKRERDRNDQRRWQTAGKGRPRFRPCPLPARCRPRTSPHRVSTLPEMLTINLSFGLSVPDVCSGRYAKISVAQQQMTAIRHLSGDDDRSQTSFALAANWRFVPTADAFEVWDFALAANGRSSEAAGQHSASCRTTALGPMCASRTYALFSAYDGPEKVWSGISHSVPRWSLKSVYPTQGAI